MLKVGLTGGMGSGKSSVARMLAERGAVVIDADRVARDVVEPGQPALAELAAEFGDDVINAGGTLDRAALAAKAFADEESTAKLNAITHPRIRARTLELFEAAPDDAMVVYDMPLLLETGQHKDCDLVMVVEAPVDTRVARLVESRGVDEADARRRIAAQATDEDRRKVANIVVDNSGDEAALKQQVDKIWVMVLSTALTLKNS
ncbi:dephospho-CoA kinase [Corynebacterium sp. 335C]